MTKSKNKTKLFYLYDKDADVMYLSQGRPSSRDLVTETAEDVLLRSDKKTGRVRGFTILNFSKRQGKSLSPIELPVLSHWAAA